MNQINNIINSDDKFDLVLVQPSLDSWKQGSLNGVGQNMSDAYELALLSEICNQDGIKTKYMIAKPSLNMSLDILSSQILSYEPTIVGFEAMNCYSNQAIKLASLIKKSSPNTIIISGGYHPSGYPEMLFDSEGSIDYILMGACDKTLPLFVREIMAGKRKDMILSDRERSFLPKGRFIGLFSDNENSLLDKLVEKAMLGYLDGDSISLVPRKDQDLVEDINKIPIPTRDPDVYNGVVFGRLNSIPISKQKVASLQTTRGCGSSCSYCQSSNVYGVLGNKLFRDSNKRIRNPENVVKELKYLSELGVNFVFLTDLTFNHSGDYLRSLSESVVEAKNLGIINPDMNFYCMFKPFNEDMQRKLGLDYDIYKCVRNMGVTKIGFGVEFIDSNKLKNNSRNYINDDIIKHLEAANNAGILTRGLMMFGDKDETLESLELYSSFMISLPFDEWRLAPLAPFPGTISGNQNLREMHSKLNLPADFDNFNANYPIILPEDERLTAEVLIDYRKKILSNVYRNKIWESRILLKREKFPSLKEGIDDFINDLTKQGYRR
jgi:anaerobic magnesium-protoporphyrin IX monomethyl ester cyclase